MKNVRSYWRYWNARRLIRQPYTVLAGVVLTPTACLAAWFLCVDWSWFIEECPDCIYHADVQEYRLITIPVARQVTPHPTVIQRIAADLGRPCTHPRLNRWHKHRWWGLCYCAAPCWNGLYTIDDQDTHEWYDTKAATVRQWGADDPGLAEVWHREVIMGHDWTYWHDFADRLGTATE